MFPAGVRPRPSNFPEEPFGGSSLPDTPPAALLRVVLDESPQCSLIVNRDARVCYANRSAAQCLGYTDPAEGLEGQGIDTILANPLDWPPREHSGTAILWFHRRHGTDIQNGCAVSVRMWQDLEGAYWILSWSDPPFTIELTSNSPQLRAVISPVPPHRILYLNAAGMSSLGYEAEAPVPGLNFDQAFGLDPVIASTIECALRDQGSWSGETCLSHRRTGAQIPVALHFLPVPAGSDPATRAAIAVFARDLTECWRLDHEARATVQRLHQLIDLAPNEMAIYDTEMRFLAVSARMMQAYGIRENVRGRSVYEVFPEIPAHWREIHQRCLKGAIESHPGEWFYRADGSRQLVKWQMRPWYRNDLSIGGVVIFSEDITEAWEANQRVTSSEVRYRTLFDQAADALFLHDGRGRIIDLNPMATHLLGYSREEFLNLTVFDLEKDLPAKEIMNLWELLEPGEIRTVAGCLGRKDGSKVTVEVRLGVCFLEGERRYLAQVRDITDRLRTQEKLRALTAQILTAQEEERRRIALELHDDFTQRLGAIGIELGLLRKRPEIPPDTIATLDAIRNEVMALTEQMRELSHQFHPGVLEHAGLRAAVESHCHEVSRLSGIEVTVSARDVPDTVPGDIALALYRILQEALHNVVRHSDAKTAHVFLTGLDDPPRIVLTVVDHGRGFLIEEVRDGAGLGLLSVEERTRLLQGIMKLSSVPSEGTRLEIEIPLPGRESK
jgi:PAS domain S-box-containing protein